MPAACAAQTTFSNMRCGASMTANPAKVGTGRVAPGGCAAMAACASRARRIACRAHHVCLPTPHTGHTTQQNALLNK